MQKESQKRLHHFKTNYFNIEFGKPVNRYSVATDPPVPSHFKSISNAIINNLHGDLELIFGKYLIQDGGTLYSTSAIHQPVSLSTNHEHVIYTLTFQIEGHLAPSQNLQELTWISREIVRKTVAASMKWQQITETTFLNPFEEKTFASNNLAVVPGVEFTVTHNYMSPILVVKPLNFCYDPLSLLEQLHLRIFSFDDLPELKILYK